MLSPKIIAFLVAVTDFALGGLISNGFIVAVTVMEWAKCRSLAASEQLLLSQGMSNICFTGFLTALSVCYYSPPDVNNYLKSGKLYVFAIFAVFSRFWLTAWLCVFYCIKIVNSTQSLFLWCKLRISQLVPWLLVGSQVFSLLVTIFAMQSLHTQTQSNRTNNTTNMTEGRTEYASYFKIFFLITGTGCPFLLVLCCSIKVVASLCRHVSHLTSAESNLRSLQTEAHIKAAGAVLFLLILSIIFYVVQTLLITDVYVEQNIFAYSVCIAVLLMYSPAQAAILMLVNPKLKQAAARMLPRAKT
ncbi:taste receptor type 2 member 1-like [Rhineura floridana]|uniref:taste receptor type 2 member 1-like n=1 Tax=Rhineura floridana TaxID=261503 RepID=UPI002AC8248E|nr:taste receptor type 2 member 1-like [Rhineura floridana]